MVNRLAEESSPYLLQHAHNPVDWYPWGPEALERARADDRPILLSIGYSSCHWCHVMERESFEDPSTAALMNRLFVSIKVDREERPDVDQVYMKAVQAMTGGGGWPMTVFLTPGLVPYYGGTYFPPEPRHGMPSFPQVLEAAADAFDNRREAVEAGGSRLVEALARTTAAGAQGERRGMDREGARGDTPAGSWAEGVLDAAYRALASRYDERDGGFGTAPKFPQPVTLELLLRHHLRTGAPQALEMVVHTLRRMAAGGLRDHLAGGFHRYSVDARWLVPHFEKMLYDNALLARCYFDAYRVTGAVDLRDVALETLDYLLADMRSPAGGFYSARDADSDGEEGTFYVWTPEEVEALLEPEDARIFARLYDVAPGGNFEGRSILHLPHGHAAVAGAEGLEEAELARRMAHARAVLLDARSRRNPPFRDEKVLVAWNGMAVRALAETGAALGRGDYVTEAVRAADFLWSQLRPDDRLLHTWMDGEAKIDAFLDDHGALGNALLSLHAATLDTRWLGAARWLCDEILARFWDDDAETVFDTASDAQALFLRPRDPMDNATPSGPSLAAELLARAGHLFDDDGYRAAAERIIASDATALLDYGPAFGRMLSVVDRGLAPPMEIVIVGDPDDAATRGLIQAAHEDLTSNVSIAGRAPDESDLFSPLLTGRGPVNGRPAAYVCRGYACRLPVTEPEALRREIEAEP
jgi:hypothetical protein